MSANYKQYWYKHVFPRELKLFINGEFVDAESGKTFPVINPANEEELCRVAEADAADVEKAVAAAEAALVEWKKIGNKGRQELLLKLANLWKERAEELTLLEVINNGTPITQQREVVEGLVRDLRYHAGWADKGLDGRYCGVDGDFHVHTQREPIGVCGMILPWNLPLWCLIVKLAPCLAMGNVCVIKPAEQTPLTTLKVAEMLNEVGFPKGVVNILPGYGPTAGAALASHMRVRKIAFTGSTEVGRIVMKAAAESNLKLVQLELGGKSPVVIFPDADIDQAVEIAAAAIFSNNGEQCDAGSRTYVHESIYDQFVEKAKAKAESLKIGDPLDANTFIGALVDRAQFEKVLEYIEFGKQEGARLVAGGVRNGEKGYFVKPTVFAGVTDDMRIAREEIFGPVQCLLKWSDPDDLLRRINDTTYGLAAGVVTGNIANAFAITKNVEAGTVWVNTYFQMFAETEFGGYKQSGFGKDGGAAAVYEWTVSKAVVVNTPSIFGARK